MDHLDPVFGWQTFELGQARFSGVIRGAEDDEAHHTFAVELASGAVAFGEFVLVYEADKTHYSVEVKSFGYPLKENVGASASALRPAVPRTEKNRIKDLVQSLISAPVDKPFPLHKRERFSGRVHFRSGWVR